jgi:hypothetical protein
MSDFDTGTALPTYGDDVRGDGLLRIQWRNGEQRSKTGGYFFVSAENVGDTVPDAPWVAHTDTFDDGTEVEGFKADELDMAVICMRSQPFHWSAPNGTQGRYKVWQTKWEKGGENQSMQVEVLALVKGFDDPVVWTSATIKTSFAIISRGGKGEAPGILASITEHMVKPASKAAGKPLDSYAFWATVATERDDKGKIVYTPTKGKAVTRPVLKLPAEKERESLDWLRARFAGKKLIADTLVPLREQYEDWRRELRTNDDEPAPVAAGRNVPQAVSEADFATEDVI